MRRLLATIISLLLLPTAAFASIDISGENSMGANAYMQALYKYIDDREATSVEANGARIWPPGQQMGRRMGMDALSYAYRGQLYPRPDYSAYTPVDPNSQPLIQNIIDAVKSLPRQHTEGLTISEEPYKWYPSDAISGNNGISLFPSRAGDTEAQKYLVRHEVGHGVAERMFGGRINPIHAPEYMEINREGWIPPDGQSGGSSGGLATEESFADDYAYMAGSPWYNTARRPPSDVQQEMLRRLFQMTQGR